MSYLSTALVRMAEQRGLLQADLSRQTGLSRAHISRVCSGESRDLADHHFENLLKVFTADPLAQAELIAARCMDARVGPGADLVEITVKKPASPPASGFRPPALPLVELPRETEKAFAWLRSQCPLNPELEKHLVGYAKITGMK